MATPYTPLPPAAQFKQASEEAEKARSKKGVFGWEDQAGVANEGNDGAVTEEEQRKIEKQRKRERKKKLKEKKKRMAALSFAGDADEFDGEPSDEEIHAGKTIVKNHEVDTSFLPDKEREQRAKMERERLQKEWLERQEAMKEEILQVTYSYWDGQWIAESVGVISCTLHHII